MALQLIPLGPPAFDSFTPLSQIGQSFFKQYDDGRKRKLEDDFAKSNADAIAGMTGPTAPAPAPQGGTLGDMGKPSRALPSMASGQGEIGQYAQSIKKIESGSPAGNYGIVGPTHPKYGRALGAYQVMEANLPSWSKQVLGRNVTPEEFLANPQLQDAIFNAKFGESLNKYGNPQDAASVWFTGKPAAQGANRRDVLGTTGRAYVDKFNRGLGVAPRAAPVQVASASPGMGYAPDTRPPAAPMQSPPMASSFAEAVPGAAQPQGMAFTGMGAPQQSAPVQRPQAASPAGVWNPYALKALAENPNADAFDYMPPEIRLKPELLRRSDGTQMTIGELAQKYPPNVSAPLAASPPATTRPMPQSGGVAPAQPAPQQMAQAGPGPGADPFGFSRMPPQVAAAVKSMLSNPLPAAQARGMAIVEMYKKTEQWSDPVTDPRTGAEFQVNRVTGERKIFQQPQDNFTVETDGRGNMVQVNTRTNQRSILDKAEGWQSFKGEDGNTYAWNPRNPQSKPVVIGQASGYRDLVTPEERLAAGIDPTDKRPVQRAPNNKMEFPSKAQTEVNLNNAAEKELDKGFANATVKRYSAFIDKGDQAPGMISDISQLRDISRRVGSQGKMAEVKTELGPYAEAMGIDVKDLSDLQTAEAIIQRLAPQMHVPGSGATSDIEFKGFIKSLGSMTKNPQAREVIYDTFEAFARYDIARADIATAFANKEISRSDAEKQIKALSDPLTRYREWKKTQGNTETAAPEVAPPGKRVPLPNGYTASGMVNEAKRALKVAPGAKSEIADKLRSHGIDPKVLD